jgi:hypothetical protein
MRKPNVLLALLFATVFGAVAALADNVHIVGSPNVNVSGNSIVIKVSVAGLGSVSTVNLTLSGDLQVISRCYNRGGNKPQADNKTEDVSINQTGTFPVRNGRTNATFTISPVSTLSCPGNQVVVVESASGTLDLIYQGQDIGDITISYTRS